MTALSETNGPVVQQQLRHDFEVHAEQMSTAMDEQVGSMRALLEDELKERTHLEQLLEASKERERRLAKAVAVLEGGVNQHAMRAPTQTSKPKPKKKDDWNVSAKTVERVLEGFTRYWNEEANGEPFTQTMLATWLTAQGQGIGGDTIRKAMGSLRDRELVRKCGTTRGGGILWAPMPDAHGA
jgi:hypothetical protein